MRRWEFVLQERYERDRLRLLDYREVNIEFKEWLINLMYEEVKAVESSEHSTDDDIMHNDRICDRECIWTEQNQDADSGPDQEDAGGTQVCIRIESEERPDEVIEDEEIDIYEEYYEEIDNYKCQSKIRGKKHGKRK